jgi:hypothetical protein
MLQSSGERTKLYKHKFFLKLICVSSSIAVKNRMDEVKDVILEN